MSTELSNPSLADSVLALTQAIAHHAIELVVIAGASGVAFVATKHYIPRAARTLFSRNLYGIDINKTTPEQRKAFGEQRRAGSVDDKEFQKKAVPEALGILAGAVYLSVVMLLVLVLGVDVASMTGPLTTITVMLLLGFVDDVLDLRWRHKIFLSAIGSLPLIMTYDGSLSVLIPTTVTRLIIGGPEIVKEPLALQWLQQYGVLAYGRESGYLVLYLGRLYLLYLSMLCIFCTNSINILAGVNGVEVGQSLVIAAACVVYNVMQLRLENVLNETALPELSSDHQVRALLLLGPFLGVSLALWIFNRYPAKVFVGDSYTYFAGTVLAVAGITGVYSKTLMLFFIPQIVNFIISLPQLFGIVPCPRHRVPNWDPKRDVLMNSRNYTILNLILWVCGDMSERNLTMVVLAIQAVTCVAGFFVRYLIASFMYDMVW